MMPFKFLPCALVAMAALTTSTAYADGNSPGPNLVGTQWNLTTVEGAPVDPNVKTTLNISDDGVGGNGGCNSYGGTLTYDGDGIAITQVVSTMMACEGLPQEQAYFAALEAAAAYTIVNGSLKLLGPTGDTLAEFNPAQ